jgi:hypothetical protein
LGKYYIWFVVIVAGLAGIIRLLLPRRFAELQLQNLGKATSISRAKMKALLFFVVGVIFGGLYFFPWGRQSWVVIGTVFTLLSAAEVYFQAKYPNLDALVFQSRLLGILYLGLAAGSYLMLGRV